MAGEQEGAKRGFTTGITRGNWTPRTPHQDRERGREREREGVGEDLVKTSYHRQNQKG